MRNFDLNNVDPMAGRPTCEMTRTQWISYFKQLRKMVDPCKSRFMVYVGDHEGVTDLYGIQRTYYGDTAWHNYCKFINDVLRTIRSGKSDYCFYVYQIADLLRFENSQLRCAWEPEYECFRVWLKM